MSHLLRSRQSQRQSSCKSKLTRLFLQEILVRPLSLRRMLHSACASAANLPILSSSDWSNRYSPLVWFLSWFLLFPASFFQPHEIILLFYFLSFPMSCFLCNISSQFTETIKIYSHSNIFLLYSSSSKFIYPWPLGGAFYHWLTTSCWRTLSFTFGLERFSAFE